MKLQDISDKWHSYSKLTRWKAIAAVLVVVLFVVIVKINGG